MSEAPVRGWLYQGRWPAYPSAVAPHRTLVNSKDTDILTATVEADLGWEETTNILAGLTPRAHASTCVFKKGTWEAAVARPVTNLPAVAQVAAEVWVRSPAWRREVRIQCGCSCGVGHSPSLDSIPGPGTSIGCGCG